ncbi:maleylpyruvate isomerase family mycothiol-dependent enzyme [Streptomyces sp. 24-1644]|uniref:maleylpyruvate isomerase family mycothiol-dependent enzyme n=1 Tax=unclassified Streptomyces TaxID=2593676 RepID=UPI00364AEC2A
MESVAGQGVRDTLPEGLADAIRGTAREVAALLPEGTDMRAPVPGLVWNVGEVAAHLAQANYLMAAVAAGHELRHGDGTPQSIAEANERALAAFDERGAGPLAEMIVTQADAYIEAIEAAERRASEGTVTTPMGPMSPEVVGSYLLTHMLGHGYDLARALDRPHMIDRARVELTLPFLITAMPRMKDDAAAAGLTARYTIRLWGGSRFGVTFADGAVTVGPRPPSRPDCTIHTEPVTFFLMTLGRRRTPAAIASGRVLSWGRKAWLAPRFPALFKAP